MVSIKIKNIGIKMNTIHKIENIRDINIIFSHTTKTGETFHLYELYCDRIFEDGERQIRTICILSQHEYEEVLEYGYYTVYDNLERVTYG